MVMTKTICKIFALHKIYLIINDARYLKLFLLLSLIWVGHDQLQHVPLYNVIYYKLPLSNAQVTLNAFPLSAVLQNC